MSDQTLLMPFLIDDPVYTLGFEAGQIWQMLIEGEMIDMKPFHTSQTDQINLMCESFGVDYKIREVDDTWSSLTIIPF